MTDTNNSRALHRVIVALVSAVAALVTGLAVGGCTTDLAVDSRPFACTGNQDCISGFECLPTVAGTGRCHEIGTPIDCTVFRCTETDVRDASDVSDACREGACEDTAQSCPSGLMACAGSCVDTRSSRRNCGACGAVCAAGEACVDGACQCAPDGTRCDPTAEVCCGGACTTPDDPACRCGPDAVACGNDARCCDDACRDLTQDPMHCGGCDVTCPTGAECLAGTCRCGDDVCPADAPGTTTAQCLSDGCSLTCDDGLADCNGMSFDGCEVDLAATLEHCGACGSGCGPTAGACVQGECDPIVALSAASEHTCARRASGRVVCWGSDDFGTIGDGSASPGDALVPALVIDEEDDALLAELALDAAYTHSCAVDESGTVWCWGEALGESTALHERARRPDWASAVQNATDIALGDDFVCVLGGDEVSCFGANADGQLGRGDIEAHDDLAPIQALPPVSGVTAGRFHACAWTAAGAIHCWGSNARGQLGSGDVGSFSPQPLLVDPGTTAAAVEVVAGEAFTCARFDDASVRCWGRNDDLETGRDNAEACPCDVATPQPVDLGCATDRIAAGRRHACAACGAGGVVCWGRNDDGRVAPDDAATQTLPVTVAGVSIASNAALAGGGRHSCALSSDAEVRCWGANDSAQLGIGNTSDPPMIFPVSELP